VNRDELEAETHRQLTYASRHVVTQNEAVDAILHAADTYATGFLPPAPPQLVASRRRTLATVTPLRKDQLRTVHYQIPCRHSAEEHECKNTPMGCNSWCGGPDRCPPTTTVAADVTCNRCRRTAAWQQAAAR